MKLIFSLKTISNDFLLACPHQIFPLNNHKVLAILNPNNFHAMIELALHFMVKNNTITKNYQLIAFHSNFYSKKFLNLL